MKRILCSVLVLAMIFALCACGSSGSSGSASSGSAEPTPAPDFVYKSSFKTLETGTRNYYRPLHYTEDGLYASCDEVVGSRAPEGVEEEYFGQYDITETRLYYLSNDGTITKIANYTPVKTEEAKEGQYDFTSFTYITGINVKDDGSFCTTESVYNSYLDTDIDEEDPEWYDHYHYEARMVLRQMDKTGKELKSASLSVDGEDSLYSQCVLDADGNFILYRSREDGSCSILSVSPDGEILAEIPMENSVESIFSGKNGDCYVVLWGSDGLVLHSVDFKAKKLGAPSLLPNDAYTVFAGSGDYPLYYTSGTNFYGYDPSSSESVKLFSWLDCDINATDVAYNPVGVSKDGTIRTLVSEFDAADMNYDVFLADVVKTPYDPSTAKKELVLATQYLEWTMQNAIIDFNRRHDDIRIVVKDYSQYNTEEDYSIGTDKMSTEIIAGNVPDMIYLEGMPVSQFAAKGILEDLYPFMEKDGEIKVSDFLPNVLKAAEYNGKLVRTVSYFYLTTVAGSTRLVGDQPGWNYDQFKAALTELQSTVEDATPFDVSTTRDDMLMTCLNLDLEQFASWETGEVNFTNDSFYNLLEFVKQFPETYNWEDYSYQSDSAESRISQGRQMLYRGSMFSTDDLQYLESCYNGTDVSFVGYPTSTGTGNMLSLDTGYAMTTSCSDKEAAWEFLRQMFTEKYYENNCSYSGFSPIRSVFMKTLEDATKVQYEVDETTGQYVLDENGERVPRERHYAIGTTMYTYFALSKSIAQAFADAVEACDRVRSNDESVTSIVREEAEAYFKGQKSAQDVAKLIQSKVKIYINEQR